jgi:cytochrome c oxidase subunit 3
VSAPVVHEPFVQLEQQRSAYRAGMWMFLASEVMLFGMLLLTYTLCRSTYPAAFQVVGAETEKVLETVNTVVLLTSSLTMVLAVKKEKPVLLLLITAALGVLFVVLKASEWASDIHKGYLPGSNFHWTKPGASPREAELFFYLYFMMTGIHMLHLSLGVCAILTLAFLTWRGRKLSQEIELGGLFWHFVDIVWVFLYPLFYLIPKR